MVIILNEAHRMIQKNFETKIWIDGEELSLNHMMQETIANIMMGFSKTLKGVDEPAKNIEIKIKKLPNKEKVDAHTYP